MAKGWREQLDKFRFDCCHRLLQTVLTYVFIEGNHHKSLELVERMIDSRSASPFHDRLVDLAKFAGRFTAAAWTQRLLRFGHFQR